jgi:hypothetical protein
MAFTPKARISHMSHSWFSTLSRGLLERILSVSTYALAQTMAPPGHYV